MRKCYILLLFMQICITMIPPLPDKEKLLREMRNLLATRRISYSHLGRLIKKASGGKRTPNQSTISRIFNGEIDPDYEDLWWMQSVLLGWAFPAEWTTEELSPKEVRYVTTEQKVADAAEIMKEKGYTQLPVLDPNGKPVGIITDEAILRTILAPPEELSSGEWIHILADTKVVGSKFHKLNLVSPFPNRSINESLHAIGLALLFDYAIVLTDEEGKLAGIITRADFLKLLLEESEKT